MFAKNGTEHLAPLKTLKPDSYAAATHNGVWVAKNRARAMLAHLVMGDMATDSTVTVTIQGRLNGGDATNLLQVDGTTAVGFTQRVAGSAVGDLLLNVPLEEFPFDEFRAVAVVATADSEFAVVFTLLDFPIYPHGVTGIEDDGAETVGVGGRAATKTL